MCKTRQNVVVVVVVCGEGRACGVQGERGARCAVRAQVVVRVRAGTVMVGGR